MFPVALDLSLLNILLVGNGKKTIRRLGLLEECGAQHIRFFADQPSNELLEKAGDRLQQRLPNKDDLNGIHCMMIVDIEEERAIELAVLARSLNILVNVEDNKPYCDFHFPSFVKRGNLLLAISSGGKSPTLSLMIKQYLAQLFDKSWAEKLEELAEKREEWKQSGASYNDIKQYSEAWIKTHYDFPLPTTDFLRKS